MEFKTFRDLLIVELEDIYSAERQLVANLPKLEKAVLSVNLKEAIHQHLQETKNQVLRLNKIFTILKVKIKDMKCQAMEGLIKEASEIIKIQGKSLLKDAALIGAAQKVEHYEIAAYGTAKSHAKLLGLHDIFKLLEASEEEESAADHKLTKIAEGSFFTEGLNIQALQDKKNIEKPSSSSTTPKKLQKRSSKRKASPANSKVTKGSQQNKLVKITKTPPKNSKGPKFLPLKKSVKPTKRP